MPGVVLDLLDVSGEVRESKWILGQKCVVGRAKGDVTFPTDKSVSRYHAVLLVVSSIPSSTRCDYSVAPTIMIIDTNSSSGIAIISANKQTKQSIESDSVVALSGDKQIDARKSRESVKIPPNIEVLLNDGDEIILGVSDPPISRFRVRFISLKICVTRLDKGKK
jgi:hypothetical protein